MSYQYPTMINDMQHQQLQQRNDLDLLLNAAKTGAVIGASGAAAVNLHRMRRDEIEWQQALRNTVAAGFTVGVATSAAAAVGRMVGSNPWLSLAATLATGTAVMYVLQDQRKEAADE